MYFRLNSYGCFLFLILYQFLPDLGDYQDTVPHVLSIRRPRFGLRYRYSLDRCSSAFGHVTSSGFSLFKKIKKKPSKIKKVVGKVAGKFKYLEYKKIIKEETYIPKKYLIKERLEKRKKLEEKKKKCECKKCKKHSCKKHSCKDHGHSCKDCGHSCKHDKLECKYPPIVKEEFYLPDVKFKKVYKVYKKKKPLKKGHYYG
ncbi:hypothetical protein HDE_06510 [Halotydeus destructor]|nr:hypothetical protein HDE_06510 [Halotydeus destructor]